MQEKNFQLSNRGYAKIVNPVSKKYCCGFTLVETLVALATLIIFFSALTYISQIILTLIGQSRVRTIATALGQERIELVRNLAYNDVGTIGGIPPGTLTQQEVVTINNLQFTVKTSVFYIDDPFDGVAPSDPINTDYKSVRIEISWEGAFPSKSPLVFITTIAPKGLETTLGGGTLSVLVFNSLAEKLQGASVHIENTTVVPAIDVTLETDSQGKVFLPGAPVCTQCYKITVTNNGYSTDRTYDVSEVTNPLKPYATIIEGEVTETSFSIDQLSSLTVVATGSREAGYPPFSGVQFQLQGAKIIGTDNLDNTVLKYDESHTTATNGKVAINNLEWDVYTVSLPESSSVDFAGSKPISPYSLLPNTTPELQFVTTAASNHSLLTIVTDTSDTPLATASVELSRDAFIATQSTALSQFPDFGQVFFSNLTSNIYNLRVTLPSYTEATASVTISNDTTETIILAPE